MKRGPCFLVCFQILFFSFGCAIREDPETRLARLESWEEEQASKPKTVAEYTKDSETLIAAVNPCY